MHQRIPESMSPALAGRIAIIDAVLHQQALFEKHGNLLERRFGKLRPPVPSRWRRVGTDSVPAWPRLSTDYGTLSRLHPTDLIGGERPDRHRAEWLDGHLRKSSRPSVQLAD